MKLVFSTDDFERCRRYEAWREALCDVYLKVDSVSARVEDYRGFIKEARFGIVAVTETLLSPQRIRRSPTHIAHLDKDCYYLAIPRQGSQRIEQHAQRTSVDMGTAALFSTAEPYVLENSGIFRALYLEFPRVAFLDRCTRGQPPARSSLNTAYGMGRIVAELCSAMVVESDTLKNSTRERLGNELLDLLAIALDTRPDDAPVTDPVVQSARLRLIMSYIDANIGDPLLNPERIARANQISVRALHYLFKGIGKSVSDWMWDRRLERCRAELESPEAQHRSVTEIAFAAGFNSMSHFCSLFRRKFGMTSSDVRMATRR